MLLSMAAALLQISAVAAMCVLCVWGSYSETAIGIPTAAALLHLGAAAASCDPAPFVWSCVCLPPLDQFLQFCMDSISS